MSGRRLLAAGTVSALASDLASRRWLCPVRNSAQSCVPPVVPPATGAARPSTGRYAPDGTAAGLPAKVPVLAPARRGDKRRATSPAHNGILQENYRPLPQTAVFHGRYSSPAGF